MTESRLLWTVEEAAELLDPPMSSDQVLHLLALANIAPSRRGDGTPQRRRTGKRGYQPLLYDAVELQRAHATVTPLLVDH